MAEHQTVTEYGGCVHCEKPITDEYPNNYFVNVFVPEEKRNLRKRRKRSI